MAARGSVTTGKSSFSRWPRPIPFPQRPIELLYLPGSSPCAQAGACSLQLAAIAAAAAAVPAKFPKGLGAAFSEAWGWRVYLQECRREDRHGGEREEREEQQ